MTAAVLDFVGNRIKFYDSGQQCLMKGTEGPSVSFLCCGMPKSGASRCIMSFFQLVQFLFAPCLFVFVFC